MTAEPPPRTDGPPERIRVGVAELAVASGDTRLTTSGLGSCVAVAVADPDAGVAGLAHVMLPTADRDDLAKPAKSVDRGVERLVAAVESEGADPDRLEAKLAGGSRMLDFSGVGEGVGQRNVARAREALADRDVPVVAEDVGGSHGRSISVDPGTWTLAVASAHEGGREL
ncbi:chemotaxis protein CheD [Halorussus salilacus]|uniref:chemotaxis protein CheD n=1 Tax=Halorussus salilacus TaxID=2953750 RepID=UPI00209D0D9D|nr:chemotaxis protein CheD [Halorussus salilacus]USZ68129.1 chemotaxis protein CheD [Halorussus salilacus]